MRGFNKLSVIGVELAVSLTDGQEMYFPLPMLRRACPCAACQGEPDALGRVVKPFVEYGTKAFDLVRMEIIGSYAVQLYWADGHGSGIYSVYYMHRLSSLV